MAEVDDPAVVVEPAEPLAGSGRGRWRPGLDIGIGVALFAFTILSRLPRLGRPDAFVFDEVYYALDGADMVRRGVERGGVVHPPVGKWLIALGIEVHGFDAVGWRLGALVAGALVVVLTYAAARQVVRNRWLAAMAGLLVALDGVSYTTGRVAMLDVFVALFTMVVVWCTLAALRRSDDEAAVRRYRWGALVALGFGIGVKWTTGYVLLVALLGFLVIEGRRGGGQRLRRFGGVIARFVVVPVGIYLACYVPWLVKVDQTYAGQQECTKAHHCSFSVLDRIRLFVDDQKRVLDFHTGLISADNSNADFAIKWADQASPSVLFQKTCIDQLQLAPAALNDKACTGATNGDQMEIATVSNPVVWFAGLAAIVGVAVTIWKRRDVAFVLLVAFFLYQWFPWVIDPFGVKDALLHLRPGALVQQRRAYSFYLAPLVAVVAIWPAVALDRGRLRWLGIPLAVGAAAAFAFYLPIWAGIPMSPHDIDVREWWEIFS